MSVNPYQDGGTDRLSVLPSHAVIKPLDDSFFISLDINVLFKRNLPWSRDGISPEKLNPYDS